jgi:HTH-type transcriptional regulator / antitoxin HigA
MLDEPDINSLYLGERTTMKSQTVIKLWQTLVEKGLKPPTTEKEFGELDEFLQDLTSRYNCRENPWSELFGLVTGYLLEWQNAHDPLANEVASPAEMLEHLMREHALSQYQLAKELKISQGNLSNILSVKKGISKDLAKKLAKYFRVSAEVFI